MENNFDNILLFKTNIHSPGDMQIMQPIFDRHPLIEKWSMDYDDEDHVLRIVSSGLKHSSIIDMITLHGYHCEELKD